MTIKYQDRIYTDENQLRVKICATAPRSAVQRDGFRLDGDGRVWAKIKSDDGPLKGSIGNPINGFRFDENGTLLIATTGATGYRHNGFAFRKDGAVFVTNGKATSKWHGLGHDAKGYLCVEGLTAAWDLTSSLAGLDGTSFSFTRESSATYYGPTGLVTTVASDGVRFDHDPFTLEKRGLLIEEARTNLCLRSEELDNASWTALLGGFAVADGVLSPDGTSNGDSITVSVGVTGRHLLSQAVSGAVSTGTWTMSCYAKAGNTEYLTLGDGGDAVWRLASFDLSNGSVRATNTNVTAGITNVGNGWYRCVVTSGRTDNGNYRVCAGPDGSDATIVSGTSAGAYSAGNEQVYVWGLQLEAARFASSYIPTTNASVTRQADICVDTSLGWFNATEGTFVAEFELSAIPLASTADAYIINVNDNTNNETIDCYVDKDDSSIGFFISDGGAAQVNSTEGTALTTDNVYRGAWSYKLNDCQYAANGVLVAADTSATMPTVDRMHLGSQRGVNVFMCGWIKSIGYYNKRLTGGEIKGMS